MSVSSDSTSIDDGVSSNFLEFCAKVRNNNHSIMPEPGEPIMIGHLSKKELMELADALLENTNVTFLELNTAKYTKSSAKAIAKYVRTSKHLQRIRWGKHLDDLAWQQLEEILSYFLHAIQESTSLKELYVELPLRDGPSYPALESMLTHTQSLRSLSLSYPSGLGEIAAAAARSGLKNNTTLRELTLDILRGAPTESPLLTSLCNHPHLRKLSLRGHVVDLDGFQTLMLSDTSKITELDIHMFSGGRPIMGFPHILRALARRPALTKLGLHFCPVGRDEARLLGTVLCNTPSLQTLVLRDCTLGSRMGAGLAELAPALYRNTSIKVLDMAGNTLRDTESTEFLRDILRSNKTITNLDLSYNAFGQTTGAVECIADGLSSNSTLLKIDLTNCHLGNNGVSILAQTLGSRNTTLQKVTLANNSITSTAVGVLLETMEQNSHITDLDLRYNYLIVNEAASILARSLGNSALPNLTRVSLCQCGIDDDGLIALVSALEQNTSLLHLDLRYNHVLTERAFLTLAESLPEIKVLQRLYSSWCTGLASAMPLLLTGLRKNTSLFRIHVANCAPSVPPTAAETAKCAGGWMQEIERLGYRNCFLPLIRAPKEKLPHLGVWPRALARVATLPDVIFEVLRSKPSLVPSEDAEGKESANETGVPGKRKRGDE
jgi:Ran GTPase-activating protein (RanGAP) involved in mRNA processing and transport